MSVRVSCRGGRVIAAERTTPLALLVLYVVSEPRPRLSHGTGMARWRQRLFLLLDRLSSNRIEQLSLPRDRSFLIGRELDL